MFNFLRDFRFFDHIWHIFSHCNLSKNGDSCLFVLQRTATQHTTCGVAIVTAGFAPSMNL